MLFFQKIVYLKAMGFIAINDKSKIDAFVEKISEYITADDLNDEAQKKNVFDMISFCFNNCKKENVDVLDTFTDKTVKLYPFWEKEIKFLQIQLYYGFDNDSCLTLVHEYITEFGQDKDVALIELQKLMMLDYVNNQERISELIEFLNKN